MRFRFLFALCLVALALAEEEDHEEPVEPTGLSSIEFPGELTISDGVLRTISIAGALVTGVAGLAAILSFLLPTLGFRTCAILGSCDDDSATAYSNPAIASNSVYDQQGYNNYHQYAGGFRKRSLEYVGPILKALSSAYDKYGPPAQQRKAGAKSVNMNGGKL